MKLEKVNKLREDIRNRQLAAAPSPGYYTWWFDDSGMKTILKPLNGIVLSKLKQRKINEQVYYALYFGISKNLKARIRWHIAQKHTSSSVKHGFISTLRHTIGALLGLPMSSSENAINTFVDEHCILEYDNCLSLQIAKNIEKSTLQNGYFPLNITSNSGVKKEIIMQLKALRKVY